MISGKCPGTGSGGWERTRIPGSHGEGIPCKKLERQRKGEDMACGGISLELAEVDNDDMLGVEPSG